MSLTNSPAQPMLTDEEIRAVWVEHGLDDEAVEDFARAIESALLSKLCAPVADERAASLNPADCSKEVYERGTYVGLFDIPKHVANELCAGISAATGARVDWHYFGGRVRVLALPAALASAPVAGEAQHDTDSACAWQVWWNQNKSRFTTTRQASIAAFAAGKDWRNAAPQASAEDVRNAALEEAAQALDRLHAENRRWHNEFRGAAAVVRALKQPQADKDGGQQRAGDGKTREAVDYPRGGALNFDDAAPTSAEGIRSPSNACMHRNECRAMLDHLRAGDVDVDRLMAAAKGMTRLYSYVWDRTDGCLVVFPENVRAFDEAFDALRMATGEAVDDATQAGQGERDA